MGRRGALTIVAGLATACALARPPVPAAPELHLDLVTDAVIGHTEDGATRRADVGGISGAYYDERDHTLYAVSDDRERPRLLTFDVVDSGSWSFAPSLQNPRSGSRIGDWPRLALRGSVTLSPPPPPGSTLDLEGVALTPDRRLFVSSEADARARTPPVPGVHEYGLDGRFVRTLPLPPAYLGDGRRTGMRDNRSFEGLTLTPAGRRLIAAMESSLVQDGPEATFDHGALTRLLVYDTRGDTAPREYAYRIDPLQRPLWTPARAETGVAEVLAVDENVLLVLERGYVAEAGPLARSTNTIRLYEVTLDPDAEITGRLSLRDRPPAAVLGKRLVLDLASLAPRLSEPLRRLENFEAMTFGPRLRDGSPTVLLFSDDNFSPRQVTGLVVLRVQGGAPPTAGGGAEAAYAQPRARTASATRPTATQ